MGRVKSEMFEDELGPDDELVPKVLPTGLLTGEQVKHMRLEAGVSQSQLADFLGYFTKGEPNRSMITLIEQGKFKMNRRLDTSIKTFFSRLKERQANDDR